MNKEDAARRVDTWITDHGYDRARGDKTTTVDMLRARLIEALTDPQRTDPHAGRRL